MPRRALRIEPVTKRTWPDFAGLFESRGCPGYCWCTVYRERGHPEMSRGERKASMKRRLETGTPIGLLAYDGEDAVGWCSVAPRETYARLERSRTMPRVDEAPTWTVLCFFVRRTHRGQGLTKALLKRGLTYARSEGAQVVEGFPFDTAGITSTHRGHSSVFEAAGFAREGKRWVWRSAKARRAKVRQAA